MRIPWYIYLPLMIGSVAISWFARTRKMNFIPEVVPLTVFEEQAEAMPIIIGPPAPEALAQSALELEPANPDLNYFSHLSSQPEQLVRVYDVLRADQQFPFSYLAGERLMEHPTLTDDNKREIAQSMALSLSVIEPYVYDLAEEKQLGISLSGVPTDMHQPLGTLLSQLISESSGALVQADIKTSASGKPTLSITMGQSTLQASLTEITETEILSTLYILLVTELNKSGLSLPLWSQVTSQELIVALTRNAWARAYQPPPAVEIPEDLLPPAE